MTNPAKKYFLKHLLTCLLIALSLLNFYTIGLIKQKRIVAQESMKQQEINFWNEVIKQNGHFRDAYLALAKHYQKIGKREIARIYLKKAYGIDPNNEEVKGAYFESSAF